jgi:hypothetical protein
MRDGFIKEWKKKTTVANLRGENWISYEWNEENHDILFLYSVDRAS